MVEIHLPGWCIPQGDKGKMVPAVSPRMALPGGKREKDSHKPSQDKIYVFVYSCEVGLSCICIKLKRVDYMSVLFS